MIVVSATPSFGATACHNSSVTNGISGCSSYSRRSSTYSNVCASAAAAAASSPLSTGFDELDVPVAELVPRELVERLREQVEAVGGEVLRGGFGSASRSRDRIQRSASVVGCGTPRLAPSEFISTKRVGVPQLVAEVAVALARAPRSKLMSRPCVASEAKVKRSASAPKAGMPSGNSLARGLLDPRRELRLHQPGGALLEQRLECDAVDRGRAGRGRCPWTSTSSGLRASRTRPWM